MTGCLVSGFNGLPVGLKGIAFRFADITGFKKSGDVLEVFGEREDFLAFAGFALGFDLFFEAGGLTGGFGCALDAEGFGLRDDLGLEASAPLFLAIHPVSLIEYASARPRSPLMPVPSRNLLLNAKNDH